MLTLRGLVRRKADWGNTIAVRGHSFKCGCWTNHELHGSEGITVTVHPCGKHWQKLFKMS